MIVMRSNLRYPYEGLGGELVEDEVCGLPKSFEAVLHSGHVVCYIS